MLVSLEDAIRIRDAILKQKIVLYQDNIDYILGLQQREYIYCSDEIKKEHIKTMQELGWNKIEARANERIYLDFSVLFDENKKDENIYLPCAIFERMFKSNLCD